MTMVHWAHVLDEDGSADLYDTEDEARAAHALGGGGLERIETTVVVPFGEDAPRRTRRPEISGAAVDAAGLASVIREYLIEETNVSSPAFHAAALTHRIVTRGTPHGAPCEGRLL